MSGRGPESSAMLRTTEQHLLASLYPAQKKKWCDASGGAQSFERLRSRLTHSFLSLIFFLFLSFEFSREKRPTPDQHPPWLILVDMYLM